MDLCHRTLLHLLVFIESLRQGLNLDYDQDVKLLIILPAPKVDSMHKARFQLARLECRRNSGVVP